MVCSPWLVHSQPFCISDSQSNPLHPETLPDSPAGSQQRSLACGLAAEASQLCQKKNMNFLKLSCPEGPWILIKLLSGKNWRIPATWLCYKEESEEEGTPDLYSVVYMPAPCRKYRGTVLPKGATAEVKFEE